MGKSRHHQTQSARYALIRPNVISAAAMSSPSGSNHISSNTTGSISFNFFSFKDRVLPRIVPQMAIQLLHLVCQPAFCAKRA